MKLFVTGGAGFIGSTFIRCVLAETEHEVVNFDKLTYAGNLRNLASVERNPRYSFVRGDICDTAAVESAMHGCGAVVHFAAESHVDRSIYEPNAFIDTNVVGTSVMLRVARELDVERFLLVSTDEVYGDLAAGGDADESFPLRPSSPYSASKASADLLALSFVRTYGFPAVITRCSNNYGPFQFPEKFLPLLIVNAEAGRPLPLYGDGLQVRDWIHVEDHCRAIMAVFERGRPGEVYNIGGSAQETNLALARRLLHFMKRPDSLITHVTDRPGHDRRYAIDCSKLREELGWRPLWDLENGLRQTIAWYRDNPDWVESVRSSAYLAYYEQHYLNREQSLEALSAA
jgi:dTDP-glucose 4,6-dehydratase